MTSRASPDVDRYCRSIEQCREKLKELQQLQQSLEAVCDALGRALPQTQSSSIEETDVHQRAIGQSLQELREIDTRTLVTDPRFCEEIEWLCGGHPQSSHTVVPTQVRHVVDTMSSSQSQKARQFSFLRNQPLEAAEYERYGRQMIMPEVGLQGQLRLKKCKVLIVGAGGLGCPAAAYIAGAGVGSLGIVDGDIVETSNLHRQILHNTGTVGMLKVDSAVGQLKKSNPLAQYVPHGQHLSSTNALDIIANYDIVLDCTDRPSTRYLISDACVILEKPLVSASALRTDGQLSVLNHPARSAGDATGGPCYRCVWPKPPPAENVVGCSEGGILGPVVGIMGVFMALETIKILVSGGLDHSVSQMNPTAESMTAQAGQSEAQAQHRPTMMLFSAFGPRPMQTIRLQSRRKGCPACSSSATITAVSLASGSLDYVAFCGVRPPVDIVPADQRIAATEYAAKLDLAKHAHSLVDVRETVQYDLCHMPESINIPWSDMEQWREARDIDDTLRTLLAGRANDITFVCRFGNDSQLAVRKITDLCAAPDSIVAQHSKLTDVIGGWRAWRENVDPQWPDY